MKYTAIPEDVFKNIQLNAGILVDSFTPASGEFDGIIGATSGGVTFAAKPTFSDWGEDIDNCPKGTKELKRIDDWSVSMSGTFATVTAALGKALVGAADIDNVVKIVPRRTIESGDFKDMWWIGDYSDINEDSTNESAGFCAIHLLNGLSTGGFQIKTEDKNKGKFAFEFSGHYSISDPETVPFEVFVKMGDDGE